MSSRELPSLLPLGRLHADQVAKLLGFASHDIPVLIQHRLLKPLGDPTPNAVKYFARSEILAKADERKWLDTATSVVYAHWQEKNAKRTKPKPQPIAYGPRRGNITSKVPFPTKLNVPEVNEIPLEKSSAMNADDNQPISTG